MQENRSRLLSLFESAIMAEESKTSAADDITLLSQEGERFVVPRRVAQMSELVKVLTEDGGTDEPVPLMDVKTAVLAKVLEFCRHHVENKLPEIEKVRFRQLFDAACVTPSTRILGRFRWLCKLGGAGYFGSYLSRMQ